MSLEARPRSPEEPVSTGEDSHGQEIDAAELARRQLRRRAGWLLLTALTLAFGFARHGARVGAFFRREIDLTGAPIYVPIDRVSDEAFGSIPFAWVHEEVIPSYVRALSHADSHVGRRRAEYAHRRLLHALEADSNLVELWRELGLLLRIDPIRNAQRIDYLLWAHNRYLEMRSVPYRLEATLTLRGEVPRLMTRSYEVVEGTEDARGHRVRLLRRVDRLALVESWLGHTDREVDGAMLVSNRILHFAIRHVWPGLAPALAERRPPRERGALPLLRQEAARAIEPSLFAILVETAEDQQALLDAAASVEARHACGSTFRVYDLPYRGLSRRSYAMLGLAIERSRRASCPDITLSEAAQIVGASERLSQTARLEDALEALTAFVARAVAVHEVRHVADGPSRALACPGCPAGLAPMARAELSAYLASFGDEDVGATAALIACANPETSRGVDAEAIRLAVGAVLPHGCEGAFPADFARRGRDAERHYFGTRERVSVARDFPRPPRLLPRRSAPVVPDLSWLGDELEVSAAEAEPAPAASMVTLSSGLTPARVSSAP